LLPIQNLVDFGCHILYFDLGQPISAELRVFDIPCFIFTCSSLVMLCYQFQNSLNFVRSVFSPCLSRVGEVLMTCEMHRHIRNFGLICPFQSWFTRHHSKLQQRTFDSITEDGQVTVLVMMDFTQALDMIAHDLMVCSQRYSDWATPMCEVW
jgi:hypothetical protein